jgi:hypothetical protein
MPSAASRVPLLAEPGTEASASKSPGRPRRRVTWQAPPERGAQCVLPPALSSEESARAGLALTSYLERAKPATCFDIFRTRGAPKPAQAVMAAIARGDRLDVIGGAFADAMHARSLADTASAFRGYQDACAADGTPSLPITINKVVGYWAQRVVVSRRKSSGLQSITSRLLTHAALLGHGPDSRTRAAIWEALPGFCSAFPCEVASVAPPLGATHGLLRAIAYADERAEHSLFYRCMSALLHTSRALYCRPTAILEAKLRRSSLRFMPPGDEQQGGLVVSLLLPKKRKHKADRRLDSHAIPMGPAVHALLSLLDALGLLKPGADPEGIVFPEIDPVSNAVVSPALTVRKSSALLRKHVFIPAGLPEGTRLTLRSIRSGASTDAVIAGVTDPDRLAQGGWATLKGAETYLDRALATLSRPAPGTVSGQR